MPNSGTNRGADYGGDRRRLTPSGLGPAIKSWSTPSASDDRRGTSPYSEAEINRPEGAPMTLAKDVAMWPSPRSEDSESCGNHPNAQDSLMGTTKQWPTPYGVTGNHGPDWARPQAGNGGSVSRGGDRIDEPLLAGQANQWATPMGRDYRSPNAESYQDRSESTKGEQLVNQVEHHFLPQDQRQTGDESRKCSTRRLNPTFVCWLMGVPWFWTRAEPINSAAAETAAFRSLLLSHLSSLCGGQE
jgi:hypothetical protein